ncbi:putative sugar O-methyltransferase [Nisaea sediminum]|uniref:putative sugar O-methyltransferase n=1 Tax=Nisaea sediminum TaxID=2775867 RepID=UPI00186839FC|nr:putative sugar O-methyltransferase [Nisaea sediminum]
MSFYTEARLKSLQTATLFQKTKDLQVQDYTALIEAVLADPTNNFIRSRLFETLGNVMQMALHRMGAVFQTAGDIPGIVEELLPNKPEGQAPVDPDIMPAVRAYFAAFDQAQDKNAVANPHWNEARAIVREIVSKFVDPRSVVYYAQSRASGFDHRMLDSESAKFVVERKMSALAASTGVMPLFIDEIAESPYSVPQSLFNVNGTNFSNSILWHARFFISIWKGLADRRDVSVLEIGGGYGGLARLMLRSGKVKRYVIVDLPESLVSSYCFLKLNFPHLSIALAPTRDAVRSGMDADVLLVPSNYVEELSGQSFDIAINTGSFQEMPRQVAERFVTFLEKSINLKYMYSVNYTMLQRFTYSETRQVDESEENLVAPVFDACWMPQQFCLNPPDISVETPRNWLEVFLERDSNSAGRLFQIPEEKFTQDWFCAIWSNLWKAPSPELVELYFEGIRKLFDGETGIDYYREPTDSFDRIGEVIYWRRYRDGLKG